MTRLAQAPRVPVEGAVLHEPQQVVDIALGVAGAVVGTGVALGRAVADLPLLHQRMIWRPRFVPERWQPATLLEDAARHGAARRADLVRAAQALLDHWAPVVVERVVSRLDLTGLVLHHVALDEVVRAVDVDAVAARLDIDAVIGRIDVVAMVEEVINAIDLDAIVGRVDLDAAVAGVDLDAAVAGVDIDAIAARLDLDAVIARVDLVAMVEEVIDAIALPAIIRDSSGSMASETIRGARMTGISADEAISRSLENHLFRLRRKRVPPEAPP
jgi:hypothetical protein